MQCHLRILLLLLSWPSNHSKLENNNVIYKIYMFSFSAYLIFKYKGTNYMAVRRAAKYVHSWFCSQVLHNPYAILPKQIP